MRLLLLGATGLVGLCALEQALATEAVDEILAPTRTLLAPDAKFSNPVAADLAQLIPEVASFRPDAVICALGTTRLKAGSKEAFRASICLSPSDGQRMPPAQRPARS